MKNKIRKIAAIGLMFIFFMVTGVLGHEAGHLTVNNLLGGTGEIFYDYTWTSGHMDWVKLPAENIWMVYVGGGVLIAAFLFLFVWVAVRLTPEKSDIWVEAAVSAHIITNLLYTPTELILYYKGIKLYEWASLTSYIVSVILFFLLYIKIIIKWVHGHYGNNCKK